ncbi:MAG: Asp-tRNA(Asn)/Glu-tRNA(Gln) amidotransferase subunit GatB [Spirochaetia bacterium]
MNNKPLSYDESTGLSYQLIIGIETHVQVLSQSKAYCGCENRYGGMPNSRVCPVCLGLPGALPRVNKRLYEAAILAGLAFGSKIQDSVNFVRKNYMYPDLTKGYQITQSPQICQGGYIDVSIGGERKRIDLVGLHMEEDVGKSLHLEDEPETSYIDYNRCGAPLLEIVTHPCLHTAEEAVAYAQGLRELVRHLGISNGDMEEGSLRCDANVNLHIHCEDQIFATPIAEIKNMNSFRSIRGAIEFEITRQLVQWKEDKITLHDKAGIKTTRSWDDKAQCTLFMRSKGPLDDYRFFNEPDIPCTIVPHSLIQILQSEVGELPIDTRIRLKEAYGLSDFDVETLTQSRAFVKFYEQSVQGAKAPKKVANWILSELVAVLKEKNLTIETSPISAVSITDLSNLVEDGQINGKQAKTVFEEMVLTGEGAQNLVQKLGLSQVADHQAIEGFAQEVLHENPQAISDYKNGKDNALKFMMGQLMKKSRGKANPDLASQILQKLLQ